MNLIKSQVIQLNSQIRNKENTTLFNKTNTQNFNSTSKNTYPHINTTSTVTSNVNTTISPNINNTNLSYNSHNITPPNNQRYHSNHSNINNNRILNQPKPKNYNQLYPNYNNSYTTPFNSHSQTSIQKDTQHLTYPPNQNNRRSKLDNRAKIQAELIQKLNFNIQTSLQPQNSSSRNYTRDTNQNFTNQESNNKIVSYSTSVLNSGYVIRDNNKKKEKSISSNGNNVNKTSKYSQKYTPY